MRDDEFIDEFDQERVNEDPVVVPANDANTSVRDALITTVFSR